MSFAMQTPQRPLPGAYMATPAVTKFQPGASRSLVPASEPAPKPAVVELSAVERAAKTINKTLDQELLQYPELDAQIGQGMSSDYSSDASVGPFQKVKAYPIPDKIFEQYNQAQISTMMGLFADINHAWVTIDNALYLWDYTHPNPPLVGFEEQPNTITAVRMVRPRAGVFIPAITRLLVVATINDLILVGMSIDRTPEGEYKILLYQTKMTTPIRGLDITCIEGEDTTGRIFFSGSSDNDVYEIYYQQEEKWFWNRCWKINQTTSRLAALTPSLDAFSFSSKTVPERTIQMAADKSRQLLYTLSSISTIRVFHMKANNVLELVITKTVRETLNHIAHMTPATELISTDARIVSIQPISSQESSKLHLMATISTGCRIFMSATSSFGYLSSGKSSVPTSMQVHHVKFPPPRQEEKPTGDSALALNPPQSIQIGSHSLITTRTSSRYPPGYFFCFVSKNSQQTDTLFISAPDSGRIARASEPNQGVRYIENGLWLDLGSRAEDIGLVTEPFAASDRPAGFGNELAVQYDKPTAEIAILTNTGIHTLRRQRLVDSFASAMRPGKGDEGLEGEVKKFIRLYGRSETAASALAVACGQGLDVTSDYRVATITDPDILDHARSAFIEHGGKPSLNENTVVDQSVSTIDLVKPSPRHDGLALYISRLVRSLWKSPVIREVTNPVTGFSVLSPIKKEKLQDVQEDLTKLQEFLNKNKSFIDGLAGPEALGRISTKQDEVSLQAEHRALYALVTLISNMVEGISFVQMLFSERIDEIILSLAAETREEVRKLTYEGLFCTTGGRTLAKELVKAIVNRNILNGANVDTVADSLRRRCGSFCSPADVIIFKAQEQLKRATEAGSGTEFGRNLLNESLRLFMQVVDSLLLNQLQYAVDQYISMQFYAGAIELALKVAQEKDRGNRALTWIQNGRPENDPDSKLFTERKSCYNLVHQVIASLDKTSPSGSSPQNSKLQDPSLSNRLRAEAYAVIDSSDDEVFQTDLYDWYISQGQAERLLDIQSPYVITYLLRKSPDDLSIANLLWRYYSQAGRAREAATVQLDLAKSDFPLTLEQRIEYLSRAKTNASAYTAGPGVSSRQKLLREITDFLDTASIQDDILQKLKGDERLVAGRKEEVLGKVNGQIMSLDELYSQYADNAAYYDICILIYHAADYRKPTDIRETWKNLLGITDQQARDRRSSQVQPYEAVANAVRTLGTRLNLSETTFPIHDLIPMLKRYSFEHQRGVGPEHWVMDLFLDLGVPHEAVFAICQAMLYNDEVPFHGQNRQYVASDLLYVAQKWLEDTRSGRPFGGEGNAEEVLETVQLVLTVGLVVGEAKVDEAQELRARVTRLLR